MRIDLHRPLSSYDYPAIARNMVWTPLLTLVQVALFSVLCALAVLCVLGLVALAAAVYYLLPAKYLDRMGRGLEALIQEPQK